MNNFFISPCTLLVLILNGTMVGMHHAAKNLASKNYRAHSVPLSLKNQVGENHNPNNSPEINSKDDQNKQGYYILSSIHYNESDKMAYYKQWLPK